MIGTITAIVVALIIYWAIGYGIYLIFNDKIKDETSFLTGWAFGLVGVIIEVSTQLTVKRITRSRRKNERAILRDVRSGKTYQCNMLEYSDFRWYTANATTSEKRHWYEVIKLNVKQTETEGIPYVTKSMLRDVRVNCNHCEHQPICNMLSEEDKDPLCTVNPEIDMVDLFDKFEEK